MVYGRKHDTFLSVFALVASSKAAKMDNNSGIGCVSNAYG